MEGRTTVAGGEFSQQARWEGGGRGVSKELSIGIEKSSPVDLRCSAWTHNHNAPMPHPAFITPPPEKFFWTHH